MLIFTCPQCDFNNTTKVRQVSECSRCQSVLFLDGDAYCNQHEWVIEQKLSNGEWAACRVERFKQDEWLSKRPESFPTVQLAYEIIKSHKRTDAMATNRIHNTRTGRIIGPVDFSLVDRYDPSMDPDPEAVAQKIGRGSRRKSAKKQKTHAKNNQTAAV